MRIALATAFVALASLAAAQSPSAHPAPPPFRVSSEEVLLDLVVRDKRGRIVDDLTPSDFEIYEDGVRQTVRSLSFMRPGSQPPTPSPAQPSASGVQFDQTRQLRLIVLAFDRLGPQARTLARQAVEDMMKREPGPMTFYAVARLDPRFKMVRSFTNDPILLRWAAESVLSGARPAAGQSAIEARTRMRGETPPLGGDTEAILRGIEEKFRLAETELQGYSSIEALWNLSIGLRLLEGRKSVIYFSEGLPLTSAGQSLFRTVVGQANRDNVAFYAIDARGLSSTSQTGIGSFSSQRDVRDIAGEITYSGMADHLRTDALYRNQIENLRALAEQTGGFLVSDSNDLRQPLGRIEEDARSHYLLAYTPSNRDWDGKFRPVEVRLKRDGLVLQSRSGYFALPPGMQALLFPYEVPLLKALSMNPPPRQFDYSALTYRFQPLAGDRFQAAFHIEVPMKEMSVVRSAESKTFSTEASFLVFVKDPSGTPVRKASRTVPYSGPLEMLPQFQAGNIVYDDYFPLPPGRYTVETAVLDRIGERVSARRTILIVPAPAAGPALSSIVLVSRVETGDAADITYGASDDRGPNPFRFSGGRVIPAAASVLDSKSTNQIPLYFVLYPEPGASAAPELFIEFYRDGQRLSQSKPALPSSKQKDQIPYLAVTPIESFTPGDYEARVVLRQGRKAVEQRLGFRVE